MALLYGIWGTGLWLSPIALFAVLFDNMLAFQVFMMGVTVWVVVRRRASNAAVVARRDANPLPPPRWESMHHRGPMRAQPTPSYVPKVIDPAMERYIAALAHAYVADLPDPFAPPPPAPRRPNVWTQEQRDRVGSLGHPLPEPPADDGMPF